MGIDLKHLYSQKIKLITPWFLILFYGIILSLAYLDEKGFINYISNAGGFTKKSLKSIFLEKQKLEKRGGRGRRGMALAWGGGRRWKIYHIYKAYVMTPLQKYDNTTNSSSKEIYYLIL